MPSNRGPRLVVSGGGKLDEYLRKMKRQAGNANKGVKIGFPQGAGTTAGGAPYAAIAAVNEFGAGDVPARPHIRPAVPGRPPA